MSAGSQENTASSTTATQTIGSTSSYTDQFGPWVSAAHVEPNALESATQPLAYLNALWKIARRLEQVGANGKRSLDQRRPDIGQLELGEPALNQVVPTLRLTVAILEGLAYQAAPAELKVAIAGVEPSAASVTYQMLRQATSPFTLPYDRAWALILQVCRQKKVSPWKLLRKTDYTYPNFGDGSIAQAPMRDALGLCLGMAPVQIGSLTGAIASTNESAWWSRVGLPLTGADTPDTALTRLSDTRAFLTWTGLTRKRMRKLLAVYGVAKADDTDTQTSVNQSRYGLITGTPASHRFAASFINASATTALRLKAGASGTTVIDGLTVPHMDRIWRVLQLRKAIGCSFPEIDRLLQAIMTAQDRGTEVVIDEHAVRTIGLYCHLRDIWGVSVDAFAAVIERISPYATGREIPYYDRLFLPTGEQDIAGLGAPLTMDGAAFDPATDADQVTVRQLCAGLRIQQTTLRALCHWIGNPRRDLAFVSACHRLVMLPRWFGLNENEGLALLGLLALDQPELFRQLTVTTPIIESGEAPEDEQEEEDEDEDDEEPSTDIVDAITTVMNMAEWLKQHRLSAMAIRAALDRPTQLTTLDPTWKAKLKRQADAWKARADTISTPHIDTAKLTDDQRHFAEDSLKALTDIADTALLHALLAWVGESLGSVLDIHNNPNPAAADMSWLPKMQRRAQVLGVLGIGSQALQAAVSHPDWFDLKDGKVLRGLDLVTIYRLMSWVLTVRAASQHTRKPYDEAESKVLAFLRRANRTEGLSRMDAADEIQSLFGMPAVTVRITESHLPHTGKDSTHTRFVHARALAWLLRIQDLATKTSLSVEALLAMSDLEIESAQGILDATSQALLAACTADEREAIQGDHDASRRDAIVAWLLAHAKTADGAAFPSRDALSTWALTDIDVGPEPRTTRAAQAIDALQLYIHRLLSGEEARTNDPGLKIEAERKQWTQHDHTYATWKRQAEEALYPENRFDPTQRTHATPEYSTLQTQLAQAGDSMTAIEEALRAYIADFERNSTIQIIAGYQEGVDVTKDVLHFLGCTLTQPIEYYWRTVDLSVVTTTGLPSMLAWGAWEKVFPAMTGTVARTPVNDKNDPRKSIPAIRPAVIRGRRYLVWAEHETSPIVLQEKNNVYYALSVFYSYCDATGHWTPANQLIRLDGRDAKGTIAYASIDEKGDKTPQTSPGELREDSTVSPHNPRLVTRGFQPGLIAMEDRSRERRHDPCLVVILFDGQSAASEKAKAEAKKKAESTAPLASPPGDTTSSAPNANAITAGNIVNWKPDRHYFMEERDLSLNRLTTEGTTVDNSKVAKTWIPFFSDGRVLQHPYIGSRKALKKGAKSVTTAMTPVLSTETRMRSITKEGEPEIRAMLDDARENLTVTATFDGVWQYGDNNISNYQTISGTYYVVVYIADDHRNVTDQTFLLSFNYNYKQKEDASIQADGLDPVIKFYLGQTEYGPVTDDHTMLRRVSNDQIKKLQPIEDIRIHVNPKDSSNYGYDIDKLINDLKVAVEIDESANLSSIQTLSQEGLSVVSDIGSAIIDKIKDSTDENIEQTAAAYCSEHNKPFITTRVATPELPNTEALKATLSLSSNNLELSSKTETFAADGDAKTSRISLTVPAGTHTDIQATLTISVPETPGGTDYKAWRQHDLPLEIVSDAEDIVSTISIRHNAKKVQYLDLDDNQAGNKVVRANTLIAKEIAQRVSTRSYGDVIASMGTELAEPPVTATGTGTNEAFDFGGANGLYFWEMFFHVPFLVARHLSDIGRYDKAWSWCRDHIFDPFSSTPSTRTGQAFWNALPLAKARGALRTPPRDAEGAGYRNEAVFKKAVHYFLANLWRKQGDDLFRQLTRESLREAGLCYRRAQALIGTAGEPVDLPPWKPVSLAAATAHFIDPYNVTLQDAAILLQQRLDNLRHGRTIDGAIAPFLAYEDDDSSGFVGGRPGAGAARGRYRSTILLTHYRYDKVMPLARQAVAHCIDLGRYLIETYRLSRSHASALLRHRTLIRMAEFDIGLKIQLLVTAQTEKLTLGSGRRAVEEQLNALESDEAPEEQGFIEAITSDYQEARDLLERGNELYEKTLAIREAFESAKERAAARSDARKKEKGASYAKSKNLTDDHVKALKRNLDHVRKEKASSALTAEGLRMASSPLVTIANFLRAFPNIFGFSNGGYDPGAIPGAIAECFEIGAMVWDLRGMVLGDKEEANEKEIEKAAQIAEFKQKRDTFDLQLAEQEVRIEAAQREVDRATAALDAAREQLALARDDEATFQWSLEQLNQLHQSIFQSTLNLCLLAEGSLQIETGDLGRPLIPRDAWNDRHRGWFAGEALHNGLLAMDAARLGGTTRPFRITRQVSLKTLGDKPLKEQFVNGSMTFDLKSKVYDEDFPGHYFRRIRFVKVSILAKDTPNPAPSTVASSTPSATDTPKAVDATVTTGASEAAHTRARPNDVGLILAQVTNTIVTHDDPEAIRWLRNPVATKPASICDEVRLGQKIAITRLTTDPVTAPRETAAIQVDMDGKYDYFEYTGAISSWKIHFPSDKSRWELWLDTIDDIVLEITYDALEGSDAFRTAVMQKAEETSPTTPALPSGPAPRASLKLPVSMSEATTDSRYSRARDVLQSAMEAWATLYETHGGSAEAATPEVKAKLSPYYATFSEAAVVRRMNRLFRPRPELTSMSVTLSDTAQGDFTFRVQGEAPFPDGRPRQIDDRAVVRVTDDKAAIVLHAHWIDQAPPAGITPPVRPVTLPASTSPAASDTVYAGIKDILEKAYEAWVKFYELIAGDRGAAMDGVEKQTTLTACYSSFRTESVDHRVRQFFRSASVIETVDVWKPESDSDSYTLRIRGYTISNGARAFFDDKALVNPGSHPVAGAENTARITAHVAWHLTTPSLKDAARITIPVPVELADATMHQHCEESRQYLEKILGVGASLYDEWKKDLIGGGPKFTAAFSAHFTSTDTGDYPGYARLLVKNKPNITSCKVELKENKRLLFMMEGTELPAIGTTRKPFSLDIHIDLDGKAFGIWSVRTATAPQGIGDRPKLSTPYPSIVIPAPSNADAPNDASVVWARHYLEEVYGAAAGILKINDNDMERAIINASPTFGKHMAYPAYTSTEYRRNLELILKSDPQFDSAEVTKDAQGFLTFRLRGTTFTTDDAPRKAFDEFVVVECTATRTVIARMGVTLPNESTVSIPIPTKQSDAIGRADCEPDRVYLERLYTMGAALYKKHNGNFDTAKKEMLYRLGLEMPTDKDTSRAMLSAMNILFRPTTSVTACEVSIDSPDRLIFDLRGTTSYDGTPSTTFSDRALVSSETRYRFLWDLKMNPPSGAAAWKEPARKGVKPISIGSVEASDATRDPRWEWAKQFLEMLLGLGALAYANTNGSLSKQDDILHEYFLPYTPWPYPERKSGVQSLYKRGLTINESTVSINSDNNFVVTLSGTHEVRKMIPGDYRYSYQPDPVSLTIEISPTTAHTLMCN